MFRNNCVSPFLENDIVAFRLTRFLELKLWHFALFNFSIYVALSITQFLERNCGISAYSISRGSSNRNLDRGSLSFSQKAASQASHLRYIIAECNTTRISIVVYHCHGHHRGNVIRGISPPRAASRECQPRYLEIAYSIRGYVLPANHFDKLDSLALRGMMKIFPFRPCRTV